MTKFFSQLPKKFLYALSGGVDSVALLHCLRENGFRPLVVHYNHRWFPHEDEYEIFCAKLAEQHDLKFVSKRAKRSEHATEGKAREARYVFLVQTAKRFCCPVIVTAHNANDQAETVLMRLLRGAGSRGLGAMKFKTLRDGIAIFRPWLEVRRKEILRYVKSHKLNWYEDPVNEEMTRFRGKVRHRLLPYLKRNFNEDLIKRLCQTANLLAEEDFYLTEQSQKVLEDVRDRNSSRRLVTKPLLLLPTALQRRVIQEWLISEKVREIDFELINSIIDLLYDHSTARLNLTRNWQVCRREGRLWIRRTRFVGQASGLFK